MDAKPGCSTQEVPVPGTSSQEDVPIATEDTTETEDSLLTTETMDRASPEIWPESIPGISAYADKVKKSESPRPWEGGLTKEDSAYMHELGAMSPTKLIMEIKKLHDLAYELGVEEAKEMTRGKYLDIFQRQPGSPR